MNYEKKYKEALERAKDNYNAADSANINVNSFKNTLTALFPELKESEDEKMRKSIIYALRNGGFYDNDKTDEAIAWLEKQVEQKSTWSKDDENSFLDVLWCCKKAASIAKDENEMGTVWYAERWLKSLKDRYIWKPSEKQGVQKSFDYENANIQQKDFAIVKTKFNKGDWIVNYYNHVASIKSIDEKHYVLSYNDGSCERWSFMYIDRNWHLWTIKDAKDGDVLVSASNQPFIYNGKFTEYTVGAYCGLNVYGVFAVEKYLKESNWTNNDNIRPATKEQRDILMKEIHRANFKWDTDKKELKKL